MRVGCGCRRLMDVPRSLSHFSLFLLVLGPMTKSRSLWNMHAQCYPAWPDRTVALDPCARGVSWADVKFDARFHRYIKIKYVLTRSGPCRAYGTVFKDLKTEQVSKSL